MTSISMQMVYFQTNELEFHAKKLDIVLQYVKEKGYMESVAENKEQSSLPNEFEGRAVENQKSVVVSVISSRSL